MLAPPAVILLLNEVLSLNAQEFVREFPAVTSDSILNEVLSLNAQEFVREFPAVTSDSILNEVLSLNAQEYGARLLI